MSKLEIATASRYRFKGNLLHAVNPQAFTSDKAYLAVLSAYSLDNVSYNLKEDKRSIFLFLHIHECFLYSYVGIMSNFHIRNVEKQHNLIHLFEDSNLINSFVT